jgi:hypothetical protein
MDERFGAVNWIKDPLIPGIARHLSELLTYYAIGREAFRNSGAQQLLGTTIGNGNGRLVGLTINLQIILPKVLERELPGRACDLDGEFEPLRHIRVLRSFRHSALNS